MAMDVKRDPAILKRKRQRQMLAGGLATVAVIAVSVWVSGLEPAAPSVPEATLYYGTVKRGDIMREVHGAGTLVPENITWITTLASGRVERIIARPGATVKPGTVILELSNPDLRQQVMDAKMNWEASKAALENAKANLRTQLNREETSVSNAQSQYNVALSEFEANKQLQVQGLVSELIIKRLQASLDQAGNALAMAKKQVENTKATEESQLAAPAASANSQKSRFDQLTAQLVDLQVKSTMTGQVQEIGVDVGQQVGPNTNLARVSDPTRLKAEVRISETMTKDLAIGQMAKVDTRNGIIKGHVSRIDPAAVGGTVGVDVILDEPLPAGARPAQSVDGTIELQRLVNVLYVESPTFGQENSTIQLFKVLPTRDAVRTTVRLGKRSVQFVEVMEGLQVGDKVVLSDMSQYDGFDRVRIS